MQNEIALALEQGRTPGGAANATLSSEDPALLRQAVVKAHAAAALRYRALFQSLKLEPEREKKLEGIVEDYELRARDIWEEGNAKGISTADPALWELMRPDYEKMKTDVTALVGEAGFQQVDQYNRSLVGRDFSTALASSLYYTDTPLTPQQTSDLVQTFRQPQPRLPAGPLGHRPLHDGLEQRLSAAREHAPARAAGRAANRRRRAPGLREIIAPGRRLHRLRGQRRRAKTGGERAVNNR